MMNITTDQDIVGLDHDEAHKKNSYFEISLVKKFCL